MRESVDMLDIESVEAGQIHERWLNLLDDALGRSVAAPMLIARGGRPGPVIGLTAAIHGDEVNGVGVIHQLFRELDPQRLKGSVVAIPMANVAAYHRHDRLPLRGFDLNHHFPGRADGNEIQAYADRLVKRFICHVDVLIDLHTASRGRANCLYIRADMKQDATARMAYLQRPQVILHNPAMDGTLRGSASALGIPAITVEVGNPNQFQREYIRRSVTGIRAVLAEWGMLPKRPVRLGPPPAVCSQSRWLYTDRGGLLTVFPKVTDRVAKGDLIAVMHDASVDGIVIGRAVDPVAATGARILFLGQLAAESESYVRRPDA